MPNDTSTLNGSLLEMKDQLIYELGQKGVTASYSSSDGLLGLIGKISEIQTGGSCYHIELDQTSYTTTGSLTVTATLQNQYQPYANQTVTFTGGTSTVTATTDSNGVATATVTFSASGTLTATYSNVSDTATITVQSYLFYDACDSSSGLTNYGTVVDIKGSGAVIEMTYDSTENAYKINPTSYHTGEVAMIPIPTLQNKDDYQISFKAKHGSTIVQNQIGVFIWDSTLSSKTAYGIRRMGNGQMTTHTFSSSVDNGTNRVTYNTGMTTQYYTFTMVKQGNNLQFLVKDENDVERYNKTFTASGNNDSVGLYAYCWDNTRYWYVKEIVAEAL